MAKIVMGLVALGALAASHGLALAQHRLSPFMVRVGGETVERRAMICTPNGSGPFPAVVFNHGSVVDALGWPGAAQRGYRLDIMCEALAKEGIFVFAPIREIHGRGPGFDNFEDAYSQLVSQAVDYVGGLSQVDAARIALAGFSTGGLTSLIVANQRRELRAAALMAPASGRGRLDEAAKQAGSLNMPLLVMVEERDAESIQRSVDVLEDELRSRDKQIQVIRHGGGGADFYYDIDYWFDDLKIFLRQQLGLGAAKTTIPD